jgi:ribosomal protein L9
MFYILLTDWPGLGRAYDIVSPSPNLRQYLLDNLKAVADTPKNRKALSGKIKAASLPSA